MASIKLKPWPFGNRIVKLHWFGNVRLTSSKNWRITVAFEDSQQIELIQYPIGLLPILRIGQYYQYGQPLMSQKEGVIDVALVHDLTAGHTEQSLNVCRQFGYFLYGKAELINQNLWCFRSNGLDYYILHTELIRALFTKNKVLANALLRPKGLVYLLNRHHISGRYARFDFSRDIPATIISDDFVQHFAWLYAILDIRNSFESIQTNVYSNATNANHKATYGHRLELAVPKLFDSYWTFRGKRQGHHVFIYEVLSFTVDDLSFDQIDYSHASIKKRVYSNHSKKKQITRTSKKQTFEVDSKGENQAKEDTNQSVVESEATQMTFQNRPDLRRIARYEQQINQGDTYVSRDGRGGALFITASVDESMAGGSIQPIDFKTLDITYERDSFGLEDFYEMVKYLDEMYSQLKISMTLVHLPLGRKFSWLPDGRRRVCAVVRVDRHGRKPVFILEIARPDQRSLSTLIVQFNDGKGRDDEEKSIHKLLHGLVFNSGSWRKEQLQRLSHAKLRHTNTFPNHWAERVYGKLR